MSYFTKITFASLFLFVSSLQASYDSEIVDIRAQGRGETREEAILNARVTALQSFAEFFSIREQLENETLTRKIVGLSVGVISDYEVISSYKNEFDQTVVEIKAKLNKNSMQLVELFPIDPDKASTNVNGEFYATESAKWRFNQKNELEALNHLLEKIQIIGSEEGFLQAILPPLPAPRSVGKSILQNIFYVDYVASENMNTVFEVVKKTLRSLSVSRSEYMTIPTREVFQVELCLDAMLFGERFDQQKKRKRRGNSIPDCEYETFYLRNQRSIQMLQRIEDYVRSEIKSTKVIRQYDNNSCKIVPPTRFDEKKHRGMKRIVNERKFDICFNPPAIKALQSKQLDEEPFWPKVINSNKHNDEFFINNLTFNTCNVAYRRNERIFFPITRQCRTQIASCAIPYKNKYDNPENASFGLNLPLGGELIAKETIIDSLREADYYRLNKYKAVKNPNCN